MDSEIRRFKLFRASDASGVSGVGEILEGVEFTNGKVVVSWLTDRVGSKHGVSSQGFYNCFDDFYFIHCKSHPNNGSLIKWLD